MTHIIRHVSVPSFGDSFFISFNRNAYDFYCFDRFPSPHSGILFLFFKEINVSKKNGGSFRPLIRGFFFYRIIFYSFFCWIYLVSVPSFGDSFFIMDSWREYTSELTEFPSPHSGILFLYDWREYTSEIADEMFPSPHSGILFLCVRFSYHTIKTVLCFRPLIRGFFFYDKCCCTDV